MAKRIYTVDAGAQTVVSLAGSAIVGASPASVGPTQTSPVLYGTPSTVTRAELFIDYHLTLTLDSDDIGGAASGTSRIRYSTTGGGGAFSNAAIITDSVADGAAATLDTGRTSINILLPASFDLSNIAIDYYLNLQATGAGTSAEAVGTLDIYDMYILKPYRSLGIEV